MNQFLTGQDTEHLCSSSETSELGAPMHREVVGPFRDLARDAREAGFDLRALSGFRSFDQQLSIWNRKCSGEIAVLDDHAVPLNISALSDQQLALAILRWSALPGASRHHWGTDLDVFDAAAKPAEYGIELIPKEVDRGGMFGPLHEWLDKQIELNDALGFFRPYDLDRNGVAPERWHLSYQPLAREYLFELSIDVIRDALASSEMLLKEVVLENLPEIYDRFVRNVNQFGLTES